MASEYLKWKYRDVTREEQAEPTPAEEQRIRADMERSRHLIEQMKE